MAPVVGGKSLGSDKKTVLKGELLIWRTKNHARGPGTLQLKDSIQFASHESKLVPRKLDPGPSSKVGVMVFYCKTLLTPYVKGY
jgi:hypothetical protein